MVVMLMNIVTVFGIGARRERKQMLLIMPYLIVILISGPTIAGVRILGTTARTAHPLQEVTIKYRKLILPSSPASQAAAKISHSIPVRIVLIMGTMKVHRMITISIMFKYLDPGI